MADTIEQGTPEWHDARRGKVTASRIADVTARTKSGHSASRATYMGQLIAERLTGTTADGFFNSAMQWGTDTEPAARAAYTFFSGMAVEETGFIGHPKIAMSGASPDGLVGGDGLIEIKCPNTATHIATLLGGSVPGKYEQQMQWQMACTGRQWCDFVSYDPRMPETMALWIKRIERDNVLIASIQTDVIMFLDELDHKVKRLRDLYDA